MGKNMNTRKKNTYKDMSTKLEKEMTTWALGRWLFISIVVTINQNKVCHNLLIWVCRRNMLRIIVYKMISFFEINTKLLKQCTRNMFYNEAFKNLHWHPDAVISSTTWAMRLSYSLNFTLLFLFLTIVSF